MIPRLFVFFSLLRFVCLQLSPSRRPRRHLPTPSGHEDGRLISRYFTARYICTLYHYMVYGWYIYIYLLCPPVKKLGSSWGCGNQSEISSLNPDPTRLPRRCVSQGQSIVKGKAPEAMTSQSLDGQALFWLSPKFHGKKTWKTMKNQPQLLVAHCIFMYTHSMYTYTHAVFNHCAVQWLHQERIKKQ